MIGKPLSLLLVLLLLLWVAGFISTNSIFSKITKLYSRSAEIAHASLDDDDDNRRVVYEDADVLRHLHLNRISSDQLAAWLPDPAMQSFLSVQHITDSSIYIQSSADLCATSAS